MEVVTGLQCGEPVGRWASGRSVPPGIDGVVDELVEAVGVVWPEQPRRKYPSPYLFRRSVAREITDGGVEGGVEYVGIF